MEIHLSGDRVALRFSTASPREPLSSGINSVEASRSTGGGAALLDEFFQTADLMFNDRGTKGKRKSAGDRNEKDVFMTYEG